MKSKIAIISIGIAFLLASTSLAFVGRKSLKEQFDDSDLVGRFKAISVEKIESSQGTRGPHEIALVELVEVYKGKEIIARITSDTKDRPRILVLQTYFYDDSPDGFDPGQEAIVFLDHQINSLSLIHI